MYGVVPVLLKVNAVEDLIPVKVWSLESQRAHCGVFLRGIIPLWGCDSGWGQVSGGQLGISCVQARGSWWDSQ